MSSANLDPANDTPHVDPPMQSPAPFLAAVAAIAILVLTGLMATEFIWTAQHPVTAAHTTTPKG